jgi:diguanylate cyclase (GGDEF)-like protein
MISNIYKNNQQLSKKEILKKITVVLRDIRFWNGTGYFFIHTLDGTCILLPPLPALENKKSINWKDARDDFIIQKAIRISKEKGKDFVDWYWYKPNERVMKKKIGYIEVFKPLNIFIGTARYEEDIISSIKSKMIPVLRNSDKEFFIYDMNGKSILRDKIDKDEVTTMIQGAKIIPEGFFINLTKGESFKIDKEIKKGTFFIRYLPMYDWVIGVNTYTEKVIENLKVQKELLKNHNMKLIKNRLIYSVIILFSVLLVTLFFSIKLKQILKQYQMDLKKQHDAILKNKEELTYNLEHDYLTYLPNRVLLNDRLKQDIKHSKRDGKQIAVMFIDVDKFKSINDSLGHDTGDILLKEIAKRLKKSIRDSDTVARFGGDEFVILIDDIKNIHDIIKVIDKIQESLKEKLVLSETEYEVTISIGISVFPNDGNSVKTLLKNADIAMYKAKEVLGNSYRFFTNTMNEEILNQITLEKELTHAVENNEFVLHYQPIVESKSAEIVGVEALIRWNHPTRGLIFPDEFIGIAEQSSVIIRIGRWVVKEAMTQMLEWKNKGYKLKKMSINIAVKQLENKGFVERLKNMLEVTSCSPTWIEIEIIERFAMQDIEKSINILNEIRKLDIEVAIDDFGTGHSSMAYLKQLPITKLKIDRAFVKDVLDSPKDKAIAESILALGSGLDLKVLAEGIETQEQREFFTYNNCQQMQGYLFSRPLPLEKIEELLQKGYCE